MGPPSRRELAEENARLKTVIAALADALADADSSAVPAALADGLRQPSPGAVTLDVDGAQVVAVTSLGCLSPAAVWTAVRNVAALPPCCMGAVACVHHVALPPGLRAVVTPRAPGEVAVHVAGWISARGRKDAVRMALRQADALGWRKPPPPRRHTPARWAAWTARAVACAAITAVVLATGTGRAGRVQASARQPPRAGSLHPAQGPLSFLRPRGGGLHAHGHPPLEHVPQDPAAPQDGERGHRSADDGG